MEPFSAIGRSLSTRRVSARGQEAEDSREENGIPTPAIVANATNFHHPGAGSVQITKNMRHPEDLERTFQRGRERSEQKSRRGKKGGTGGRASAPEAYRRQETFLQLL